MESALDRLNRLSASGESDQAPDALLASQSSPRFGAFPSAAAGGSYSSVYASYSSSFAASAAKTSANPPSHGSAAQSPTSTHQYSSISSFRKDPVGGDGDSYGAVLHKQASELEAALRSKSQLEADVRHLNSELLSAKNRLSQKDSELKQTESQLRQKNAQLAAFERGEGRGNFADMESSEMIDLRAERDALQEALKVAQQQLAKEQAARTNLEAKVAGLSSAPTPSPKPLSDESAEISVLKEQLAAEEAEVTALQESLRRTEQEWSASHKEAVSLKAQKGRAEAKLADAQVEINGLKEKAKHLERIMETKDETIQDLTAKLEKRLFENIQFDGSGKLGEDEMWKLGLNHEQMAAIDSIVDKWRDGYNRKDQELYEVSEELEQYEADLTAANERLMQLQEELAKAQAEAQADRQRAADDRTALNEDLSKAQLLLNQTEQQLSESMAHFSAERKQMEAALEYLESQNRELDAALRSRAGELEAANSKAATNRAAMAELEAQLNQLHAKVQEAEGGLSATRSELNKRAADAHRLAEAVETEAAARETAAARLKDTEARLSEATQANRELEIRVAELEGLLKAAERQAEVLGADNEYGRALAHELSSELEACKVDLHKARDQLAHGAADYSEAAARLEAHQRDLAEAHQKLQAESAARAEVASLLQSCKADLDKAHLEAAAQFKGLAAKAEELQHQLDAKDEEASDGKRNLQGALERLSASEASNELLVGELAEARRHMAVSKGDLCQARDACAAANKKLSEAEAAEKELASRLRKVESELRDALRRVQASGAIESRLLGAEAKVAQAARLEVAAAEAEGLREAAEAELSATKEQLAAAHSALAAARGEAKAAKNGADELLQKAQFEAQKVTDVLRQREDELGRIAGIMRRAMESIRSSYQRSNSSRVGSPTKESSQDKDMLDPSKYSNLEDMLGSLAQFAANKSHAVLRLEQELARKAEEIQQLEDEVQRSWTASQKESELEYTRKELAEKASECAELRVSLSRKSEEAAAAQVEVRVLHEEIQSTREEAAHLSQQLAGAEEEVARIRHEASNMALQDASRLREELEQAHSEVLPLKEQLNRRTREVRELNHMLKAWEAMRLGKDAQIASLMERCKRHEEEAAEKARSVDSLRRKLALAGTGRDSLMGSPSSNRARHIHVHMHHQPSEAGSEYEYNPNTSFGSGSGSVRNSQHY